MTPTQARLSESQIRRYSRHILLPDIGGRGQRELLAAAVAVAVGPRRDAETCALVYLAAAGIGTLVLEGDIDGAVTPDDVTGGIAYGVGDVGRPRLEALRDRLKEVNPDVRLTTDAPYDRTLECIHDEDGGAPSSDERVAGALMVGGRAAAKLLAQIARTATPSRPSVAGEP